MKNIIKKISAITMALTLLGASSAISKAIAPKSNYNLTVHAEFAHNCSSYAYTRIEETFFGHYIIKIEL